MKIYLLGKRTIASAIIAGAISFLLFFFKTNNINISEQTLWQWYYEIQKLIGKYVPEGSDLQKEIQDQLNRKLIEDENLREYKVRRDVDYALNDYIRREKELYIPNMKNEAILEEIKSPKYTETQKQILLDAVYYECPEGVMGIRGVWVDKDTNCN